MQNRPRVTVKQAAADMRLSERTVYKARRIQRLAEALGRPEILDAAQHGRMSLDEALRQLEGKPKPTRYDLAVAAFNRLDEDEKGRFIAELMAIIEGPDEA
jgi:hypothetical protein